MNKYLPFNKVKLLLAFIVIPLWWWCAEGDLHSQWFILEGRNYWSFGESFLAAVITLLQSLLWSVLVGLSYLPFYTFLTPDKEIQRKKSVNEVILSLEENIIAASIAIICFNYIAIGTMNDNHWSRSGEFLVNNGKIIIIFSLLLCIPSLLRILGERKKKSS